MKNKAAANKHEDVLVPKALKWVKQLEDDFNQRGSVRTVRSGEGNRYSYVRSAVNPNIEYSVRRGYFTCSCGHSALKRKPCPHEYAAAVSNKWEIAELFSDSDKVSKWQQQYICVSADCRVATNETYEHPLGPHKLPIVTKACKGRPKRQKRLKSQHEIRVERFKKAKGSAF